MNLFPFLLSDTNSTFFCSNYMVDIPLYQTILNGGSVVDKYSEKSYVKNKAYLALSFVSDAITQ